MVIVMIAAALILGWRHWLKYKVQTTSVKETGEEEIPDKKAV
jgi:predicted negative regulator of RcsB-dependent stress response